MASFMLLEYFSNALFLILLLSWSTLTGVRSDNQLRIGDNNETMREFVAKIFEDYDKSIPPSMYTGHTTVVMVSMMVHAMSSINVINMDYSVNMFLRQYWNDTRLAYSHRGYNQSLTLNSKKSELWVPDLYFINEKEGSFHEITTPNLLLRVEPFGQVTFSQKITVKLSCNMDLKKFPMDQQKCHVKMESYGYTTRELMFEWVAKQEDRVQFSSDLQLPEFETPPNISTETRVVKYLTGSYSYLIATFYLNRKSGFYLIQTYIPSILIVILSWVSFWIDVKAVPARISLGLLTVLSMTTQSSGALGQLPRVSYIKAIDVWMSTCLVFVFGALIEYAIANVLARRQSALEHWEELRAILDSQRSAARNGAVQGDQSSAPAESIPLTYTNRRAAAGPSSGITHSALASKAELCQGAENNTCSYGYIRQRLAQAEARSCNRQQRQKRQQQPQAHHQQRLEPGRQHLQWSQFGRHSEVRTKRASSSANWEDPDSVANEGGAENEIDELDEVEEEEVISSAEMIDRISRAAFPISFAMFNLGYWIYYIYIAE